MKRRLLLFLSLWCTLLLLMAVHKLLFMLGEPAYSWHDMAWAGSVLWHGLSMDLSVTAYIMAPVALWSIASVWTSGRVMLRILNGYMWFVAIVIAAVAMVDAILYPYWGFRLDATPVFYFTTSPGAALASLPWWAEVAALLVTAALAWAVHLLLAYVARRTYPEPQPVRRRALATAIWIAIAAAMIIPIRGGVTVSTMAPGRAYFSSDMKLNHAAVNPIFSFIYSLTHVDNPGRQFRYFDDKEAQNIVASLLDDGNGATDDAAPCDSIKLRVERPDVYLVILESFSAHLMPSMGGEPIAMRLDSIASEGVLFTDFYAESFRTDRALATILSGYPAMPTTSVLRYTGKFQHMPSLARTMGAAGYNTCYFYGGDIDFTNLRGYLVATGFSHLTGDTDFPVSRRLSKWGAHDEDVYARVLADDTPGPALRVVQTSSSHEPFEVPYTSAHSDARANAFAYADSCLGDFVDRLKSSGRWEQSLVVIVPDHWGAYPAALTGARERHHVPLVLTGGALAGTPARITAPGSQSAIAPTVLALLGLDTSDFLYPRNLLDTTTPPRAWLCEPEWAGLIGSDGTLGVVRTADGTTSEGTDERAMQTKAFLQTVYTDLDKR